MSNAQFDFRNSDGTIETIFSLQLLIQRARNVNHEVYTYFIDYQKAFN